VIDRLTDAINAHDLDALAGCFAPGFVCTWPAHPSRSFTGRDQVRRNWEMLFQACPDLRAAMTAHVRAGDAVWGEWEFAGTQRNGSPFHQLGVIIVAAEGELISRARFYMEPVDAPSA